MEDRVAIVTGSGSGIGKSIAEVFMQEGIRVVVNDIKPDAIAETCAMYPELSMGVLADISQEKDIKHLVDECINEYGRLDILVNNAGVVPDGLVKTHDFSDWKWAFDINLKGTFFLAQYASKYICESRCGRVINISSEIVDHGMVCQSAYASSKGGVSAFTRSLARILGPKWVTVNAVCPGVIQGSKMVDSFVDNRPEYNPVMQFYDDMCPLPEHASPLDVAKAVYLLTEPYATFINGQMITVNGGTS